MFTGFFGGFFTELKSQLIDLARLVRTREFWIYMAVVALLCLLAFAGVRMAMGFDPLPMSLEHALAVLLGNADAGVAHAKARAGGRALHRDGDAAVFFVVADGVIAQVVDELFHIPPRRAHTTLAPTFMDLSKWLL